MQSLAEKLTGVDGAQHIHVEHADQVDDGPGTILQIYGNGSVTLEVDRRGFGWQHGYGPETPQRYADPESGKGIRMSIRDLRPGC